MPDQGDFRESFQISHEELIAIQELLGKACPVPWHISEGMNAVAGCFFCGPKRHAGQGAAGDLCWAAAALIREGRLAAVEVVSGMAAAAYEPGLLALREGPLLESVIRRLPQRPDVLLVNATGRDHPRRAGLALHLGAHLSLPTVGVTRNPLMAEGSWPADERGAGTPLRIDDETVGCWLRTKPGAPPLAVHSAWRTNPETASTVVLAVTERWRTPEPLRRARSAARLARAAGLKLDRG